MKLTSPSFQAGSRLPDRFAFCVPDPQTHVTFGENLNPALDWSDVPTGARSLALVCHDSEVPTDGSQVNVEGTKIPKIMPRTEFFHWVLVDLPPTFTGIEEGAYARGVTTRGKQDVYVQGNARQGLNDYTNWFKGDADMDGNYHGYDGPCPPWNDERVHLYHFTLYALDVERLDLPDQFDGRQALAAISGHVIATATLYGTYTLNPALR